MDLSMFHSFTLSELQILYLLENYPTVVIVGSTGCGKTTRKIEVFNQNVCFIGRNRNIENMKKEGRQLS
jgi:HrpA-like RNA helicase